MRFQSIAGTKDILPPESGKLHKVEEIIRSLFELYSYEEIRTPIFEETSLFMRSIGENTDIVGKEMYTFQDKGGTSLTLRPELTASVLRSYIQHNCGEQTLLSKYYYLGPVFRQERPQAGRFRQFHQFGAEALGSANPAIDAEVIALSVDIYHKFHIFDFEVKLNSIGCPDCRNKYKEILKNLLKEKRNLLSSESQKRLETNPLRILDSKDERDKKATEDVPLLIDFLCEKCSIHFSSVKNYLKELDINFVIDGRIVRGLDYYTKTAFELISKNLGAQDALAGGGRYDLLVEELGGKPTPGIGFAAGMERLLLVLEKSEKAIEFNRNKLVSIVVVDEVSRKNAVILSRQLRKNNIKVDLDYHERSLKSQFREANKRKSRLVIIISQNEFEGGKITIKDMSTGEQKLIDLSDLVNELSNFELEDNGS